MSEDHKVGWRHRYDELHDITGPMPGPWTWEVHDKSMATLCGGGEDAITGHIMAIVPCPACCERATEWNWGHCQTPSIANAKLISAAPDLLAALQTFVGKYVEMVDSGDCGFWDPETEEKVIAARAAIAKATF